MKKNRKINKYFFTFIFFTFLLNQPKAISGPQDLIDIKHIKALSLKDLRWKPIGEKRLASGAVFIVGDFSGGQYKCYNAKGEEKEIELRERAGIIIPKDYKKLNIGIVVAGHLAGVASKPIFQVVATYFKIPILVHGAHSSNWRSLGFRGRNSMLFSSFNEIKKRNLKKVNDLITGNYPLALARVQLRAIQLLRKILEIKGHRIEKIALIGGSKEGLSTWIASAVDPSIKVASPQAYQAEDFWETIKFYISDWKAKRTFAINVPNMIEFGRWLKFTPEGKEAAKAIEVSSFIKYLYPEILFITGDVGMIGMHDGAYFPIGCETKFLDGLGDFVWRYERNPGRKRPEKKIARFIRYLAIVAKALIDGKNKFDKEFPKVRNTRIKINSKDHSFCIKAETNSAAKKVRLWWNHSHNPMWNDPGQSPWSYVIMKKESKNTWVSPFIKIPKNEKGAWYVEAENYMAIFVGPIPIPMPRRDCSPVRFVFRLKN